MQALGRTRSARLLGDVKRTAITRAIQLAFDEINVSIDSDRHIGLVSVRWAGQGRLHLPADVALPVPHGTRVSERAGARRTQVA
ncbi:MAG: hypothetical protein A49_09030 [Methyloceanibacter sp.]|nr:MAG: hypothetical protein A49_09030 [Methyloceanibacter sp.]